MEAPNSSLPYLNEYYPEAKYNELNGQMSGFGSNWITIYQQSGIFSLISTKTFIGLLVNASFMYMQTKPKFWWSKPWIYSVVSNLEAIIIIIAITIAAS